MSDFDDLAEWAEGNSNTSEIDHCVAAGAAMLQGAQLLATRVNSARMVALYKLLAEVDEQLHGRLEDLDPEQLMRLAQKTEEKIGATSDRILKSESAKQNSGVNIQLNQLNGQTTTTGLTPKPGITPLKQDGRAKVLKLLQSLEQLDSQEQVKEGALSVVGKAGSE